LIARWEADPEAAYVDDLRDTLADARDGLERVRTLVLDLRTFVRVDEAEGKAVDLAATLRATLRIGRTAVVAGVSVQVELADMPPLECVPARVNQAVLNLFTNAARAASPRGTVRVRLYERGDGAVVEVGDSGPGVPEAMRERIFEPFYTTEATAGGLGLGLHLAREAARTQGGDLTVGQSELGGALFTLSLPRSTQLLRL
jgi:two-component system NtrC family sensor kinase